MIQVEMNKDIRDFSPKVISIFDKRQLICVGLSALYGVPIMLYATSLDIYTRITLATVLMTPVIACGWVKMYGMPLERFFLHIIRNYWLTPTKRKYRTENTFSFISPDDTVILFKDAKRGKMSRNDKKKYRADLEKFGAVR